MILFTTSLTKESKQVEQQPFIKLVCPAATLSTWEQTNGGGGTMGTSLLPRSSPQAARTVCMDLVAMSFRFRWPATRYQSHVLRTRTREYPDSYKK